MRVVRGTSASQQLAPSPGRCLPRSRGCTLLHRAQTPPAPHVHPLGTKPMSESGKHHIIHLGSEPTLSRSKLTNSCMSPLKGPLKFDPNHAKPAFFNPSPGRLRSYSWHDRAGWAQRRWTTHDPKAREALRPATNKEFFSLDQPPELQNDLLYFLSCYPHSTKLFPLVMLSELGLVRVVVQSCCCRCCCCCC